MNGILTNKESFVDSGSPYQPGSEKNCFLTVIEIEEIIKLDRKVNQHFKSSRASQ